jgi:hypothetical protein
MAWPNDSAWGALNEEWSQVFDCGELVLPTGRLLACDPCYLGDSRSELGCRVKIPPGKYSVKITASGSTISYVSLILSDAVEVTRKHISCASGEKIEYLPDGVVAEENEDKFSGFPVETGTACFVDEGTLEGKAPFNWERVLVKNDLPFRAGSATLPWRDDNANIIIFSSGLGDGSYALVGGLDVNGNLVAMHIDFWGPGDPDEE